MSSRLALYVPSGIFKTVRNPFGKDTANLGLFQALAVHAGFEELGILTHAQVAREDVEAALLRGQASTTRLWMSSILQTAAAERAGAVLRGIPNLSDLAWLRRGVGDATYSLMGVVHTVAPSGVREQIASCAISPIQPWDALICTSPVVRDAVQRVFEDWGEYLGQRFEGRGRIRPHLPVVPLGVDGTAQVGAADRPGVRLRTREALGIAESDILVLWLGRLSFFEKAYPQAMFRALQEARAATKARIHFVMLGWFPDGEVGRSGYEQAARAYAPDITVHFLDGNEKARVEDLWAGSDIFLSLVDNIQETFGLTPLEAMAAGLPIVASDWDGYRYTIRNGIEGFLVPTLGGPLGAGGLMSARHVLGIDSYQTYVGTVAQYTAVNIGRAAQAIAQLIESPDLRRRMGAAGRERVRTAFDWPVVARQFRALVEELSEVRKSASADPGLSRRRTPGSPVTGDPFDDFAGFATTTLTSTTKLALRTGATADALIAELNQVSTIALDRFCECMARGWR